jgi:hypothetical protein
MTSLPPIDDPSQPRSKKLSTSLSRLIRRIHMYAGLFFAPWMVMYALSTLVMTHRESVQSLYPSKNPAWVSERELAYSRSFSAGATRDEIANQILADIGLDGSHTLGGGKSNQPLVITRQHAMATRRITFDPVAGKLKIERQEFRTSTFLERMHRRRGYREPYARDDAWGFTVDAAIVGMIFWCLSGMWMWWEIKTTRFWGSLSFIGGAVLFTLFAFLI